MVEWLFLVVPWGCLQFVIGVFPEHTHLLFLNIQIHFHLLTGVHHCAYNINDKQFRCSVFTFVQYNQYAITDLKRHRMI